MASEIATKLAAAQAANVALLDELDLEAVPGRVARLREGAKRAVKALGAEGASVSPAHVAQASLDNDLSQGANAAQTFTARESGPDGNDISVEFINPADASIPLSVAVVGTAIEVTLETDGASALISTAADVEAALEADVAANALVAVANTAGNDGTGVVSAFGPSTLAGGLSGGARPIQQRDRLGVLADVATAEDTRRDA